MSKEKPIPESEIEGEGWVVRGGKPLQRQGEREVWQGETEDVTYDNPFGVEMERVWFDGKVVFAIDCGQVDVDVERVKVAQEYQVVYSADLDENGKPRKEPETIEGQLNIYDSVPGMKQYSPLWQFNYVVVPRDYKPNTLRSAKDCRESGYEIKRSTVVEN